MDYKTDEYGNVYLDYPPPHHKIARKIDMVDEYGKPQPGLPYMIYSEIEQRFYCRRLKQKISKELNDAIERKYVFLFPDNGGSTAQ